MTEERMHVFFENGSVIDSSEWGWISHRFPPHVVAEYRDRAPIELLPALTNSVSMNAQVSRMRALWRDRAGGNASIYVAHSAGALTVLAALARYPEMIRALVLVDPTHPEQFERSAKQFHAYLWHRQFVGVRAANLRRKVKLTDDEIQTFERLPRGERAFAQDVRELRTTWINAYRESRELPRSWSRDSHDTKPIKVPIRILVSEAAANEDPVYMGLLDELSGRSVDSQIRVVGGCEHESIVTDIEFSRAISETIDSLSSLAPTVGGEPK